jgi:hypothetical protein
MMDRLHRQPGVNSLDETQAAKQAGEPTLGVVSPAGCRTVLSFLRWSSVPMPRSSRISLAD